MNSDANIINRNGLCSQWSVELTSQTETNLHKESYGRIEMRRQVPGKKHNINPSPPSLRTTRLFFFFFFLKHIFTDERKRWAVTSLSLSVSTAAHLDGLTVTDSAHIFHLIGK